MGQGQELTGVTETLLCSEVAVSRAEVLDWQEEELRSAELEPVEEALQEVRELGNRVLFEGCEFICGVWEKSWRCRPSYGYFDTKFEINETPSL